MSLFFFLFPENYRQIYKIRIYFGSWWTISNLWPWKLTDERKSQSKNCPTSTPKNEKCERRRSVSWQIDKRTLQEDDP